MIFDIYYNNNTTPNPAFSYPWMIKDKKQISRMNRDKFNNQLSILRKQTAKQFEEKLIKSLCENGRFLIHFWITF